MPTVLLVRHGRTAANATGVLAGWTPGIDLDDAGREQAAAVGARLAGLPLAAVVSSPLERTRQTAQAILDAHPAPPVLQLDEDLGECRYGDWTNRPLKELAKDPLWRVVQDHPSGARFPDGESLAEMSARAVGAVQRWNAEVDDAAIYVAVSHGDVIKAIVADALGLHLDQFQRISVDPGSVSVVSYTKLRPFLVRSNDKGSDLTSLVPPRRKRRRSSDAAVGGGSG